MRRLRRGAGSRSWRLFPSPRGCSAPSCRASRVQATPGSADVFAVPEQMGCEGMAQRMKRDRLAQPRGFRRLLEQPAELARSRRPTIHAAGKQPALFRRNAGVALVGRDFHHRRNRSRISAGSITLRSSRPFACTTRMIICSLSMSQARSRTTSLARSPQPYTSVSVARALRLVAMVRTRLTSSGLNTGGSFCGSLKMPDPAADRGDAA